jgi:hypothetical protein
MTGLQDTTNPQTLAFLKTSLGLAVALGLAAVTFPRLGERLVARAENALSKFAERKTRAIATLFFAVIAIRLLILPLLPVPVPGIHDEYSYLLMGDTFAHGRLTNPPHPMWVSFESFHVNWLPTYASIYPPAQGFALAIGQFLGHPWIGVLLSAAAMCAAILWMLQEWLPARWALLAASLVALKLAIASYWINSYWGGAVAATGGALLLGALPRIAKHARARDAVVLGVGIAILANSRPYEGFLFCLPSAAWLLGWLSGRVKSRFDLRSRARRVFLPLSLVLTCAAAFMGYYNWRLTGNALLLPHVLNTRTYHTSPLFLWERAKPVMHYHNPQFEEFYNHWARENYATTRDDALRVSIEKVFRNSVAYFWGGVLLLLPAVPFLLRDRKMRLLLVTSAVGVAGIFAVTWSNPHYAAPMTCVIFALIVQAIRHLRAMHVSMRPVGRASSRAIVLLLVLDTGISVARRACDPLLWPCEGDPSRAVIAEKLSRTPGKHLILVRYEHDHNIHDEWVYNGAEIDGAKVLWARELDPAQNAKLFAYFQDHQFWLVTPDSDNTYLAPYAPPDASAGNVR